VLQVVSAGGDGTLRVSETSYPPSEVKQSGEGGTSVYSLAVTESNGRPVVVTGGWDGGIRVRDLATGRPAGLPVQAHSAGIGNVIAIGTGSSQWIVSAAGESTLDVRDAQTGERIGERLYGRESDGIWNLVAHAKIQISGGGFWKKDAEGTLFVTDEALPGRRVHLSRGLGRLVRAANLSTGEVIRKPIVGGSGECSAVTVATVQGRTLILTADISGAIDFWDLESGERAGKSLNNRTHVNALDAAEVDGWPIVVSGHNDGTVRRWDPVGGLPIGEALSRKGAVTRLKKAMIGGHVVIGCLRGDTIDFIDLASGRRFSPPLNPGYSTSLAFCEFEKRLAVVTASYTGPLKIWDATGLLQAEIDVDASISDLAVAPGWTGAVPGIRILVGSSKGLMALEWRPSPRQLSF
jgi:WD40 repeat protein